MDLEVLDAGAGGGGELRKEGGKKGEEREPEE